MSPMDRTTPPPAGAMRTFDFPDVTAKPLESGLDLRVAQVVHLPVVSVHLFVRAGESRLNPENAGLAGLARDSIDGGTHRRSGAEFAEALEGIGARLGTSTGWEGTTLQVSCLADRLDEGLALLAEALLEPAFPEDEVARARQQRLAAIQQRSMDPGSVAADAIARHIYASESPYARPLGGTVASVEPKSAKHVQGFAEAYYRPGGAGLVVAGDVSFSEVEDMVRRHFGSWEGAPPDVGEIPAEPRTREGRVVVVNRPGAVQSEIRVGHLGVARSHPDVFPLTVLNTLLGGAFTSRLNLNLRERNGFTYGVRSRFGFRSRPGPFQVSTSVGTEVTAPAVGEIMSELNTLVSDGPTEDEVAGARDYIAGVFPLRLETVDQIAARVSELIVYGLADDYHHTYRDRIRAVTADVAWEAGRRHIRPAEAQIVVVGDADTVVPELEELKLGPVEVEG